MRAHYAATLLVAAACGASSSRLDEAERSLNFPVGSGDILIDERPFISVDGDASDGHTRFAKAVDATLLSSGILVVADVAESQLVYVRADGTIQRRVGQKGHGPGEFRHVQWMGRCAVDTVFVWDPVLSRMTLVDSSGLPAREMAMSRQPARIDCSNNGRIGVILRVSGIGAPSQNSPVYRAPLVVWNTAGDSVGSMGEVDLGENRPLGRIAQFAAGPERLYYGSGRSSEIRAYSYDGRLKGTVHIGNSNRPASQAHYDAAIDRLVTSVSAPPEMQKQIRDRFRTIPAPSTLPIYSGFVVDPDGILWVTTSVLGDSSVTIERVAADGANLGTVRFAAGFELFEVGMDYVLGLITAEGGTQTVVAYRYSVRGSR